MMYILEVELHNGDYIRYEIDEMREDELLDKYAYWILRFNEVKQIVVTKERIKQ